MPRKTFKDAFFARRAQVWQKKASAFRPHRSFRRSYREDYQRPLNLPGLNYHAFSTLGFLFKHWRTFGLLLIFAVFLNILLVGIMSESTYINFQKILEQTNTEVAGGNLGDFAKAGLLVISTVTTGGLSSGYSESQRLLSVIIFLVLWLSTIFLIRRFKSGYSPKLRDALYNSLAPIIPTLMILFVVFLQIIPILILIILYSSAVATDFLTNPFYALIFFLLAASLVIFSLYFLSSSLIALAIVTAPGAYPLPALRAGYDLVSGRRIVLILRLVFLFFFISVIWVLIMLPAIFLDLKLKQIFSWLSGFPFIPFMLMFMTCFSFIYVASYVYLFYRRLIDYESR